MLREAVGKKHYSPSTLLQTHIFSGEQMFLSSSLNDFEALQMQKCYAGKQLAKKEYDEAKPSDRKNNIHEKNTIYQLFKTLSKSIGKQNNPQVYFVNSFSQTLLIL